MQKNPNHVLKRTEVSEKYESFFQGGSLSQYNTPFPFFFKLVNSVDSNPHSNTGRYLKGLRLCD